MPVRKIAVLIVLLALVILSLYSFIDKDELTTPGLPSNRLTTQTTENGDKTRVDYIDETGAVTFATDKHYATVIKTKKDGRVVLEEYYDAEGNPAVQTLGHCALARHYNSDGLVDVIEYLDERGEPIVTTSGYNTIRRTYKDRLADTDSYYIDDEPVQNTSGFYSYRRSYDENRRVRELSYLDQNGELTMHKNGYASLTRSYDEAGHIAYEYFFDETGAPVAVSSGFYGLYREYDENGKTTLTTYLDANGQPMNISGRYATILYTYASDGSIATARYFNAEGDPVTIGRGQYGIWYLNGKSVYLDENGDPMLRIDNYLNTHPLIVILSGLVLTGAAVLLKRKSRLVFLLAYVLFISVMTIWYRETGEPSGQFELFWSYKQFLTSDTLRQEIISNIWLFVPLGAILYDPAHPHRWVWAAGLSVLIEALQFVFGIGLCEIDDVISNSLGALIGYGTAAWLTPVKKQSGNCE